MFIRIKSLFFCVLFCVLLGVIATIGLIRSLQQAEDKSRGRVEGLSFLIAEWVEGSFQITDYLLRDMLGHVQPDDLVYPHPDPQAHQQLTDLIVYKMNTVPNVILAGFFDKNCVITHANSDEVGWDGSHRDYCKALRDSPDRKTFVSNAFESTTGPLNITQTRELLPNQPGFHGFAALGVDLTFFSNWVGEISIDPLDVVAILDQNLRLLAREPSKPESLGKLIDDPIVSAFIASGLTEKSFRATSPIDGVPRLFSIRKVEGLPFYTLVGEADQHWQADWRYQVRVAVGALIVLWLLALFTLRTYWDQLNYLGELKIARDKLETLSITDPLTGLANRRCFDEVLNAEYQRLKRTRAPMSVIMIDLDYFKAFNDTYGHLAGDRCLKAVSEVIQQSLKRPQDLAARYGGEEFCCILPETPHAGATAIAMTIKASITALGIPHGRSNAARHVTASLGVATIECTPDISPDHLVHLADQRLYWAKNNGRDQVGFEQRPAHNTKDD
ncbi:diguanylate cyclase [Salinivibrio proteolyticus]|uniref:sensor domain-containing diguanylate cyclase n=1 Tax=Salinivibrio proteolyticus TaxID=334715 RepID=UPI0009890003|nr:diguanylate cyclase [Salinivibrio proteolyticus]OOF31132.1 hypothetical protein BZJ20_06200 [Salinivibrio proteolyticus]